MNHAEIYNSEEAPNDLSRYELTGEADFVFPEGTVLAGRSYLVVASNPASVELFYGITGVLGPYVNLLNNDGGTVRLRNQMNAILQDIQYSDDYPWPAQADGAGYSLVMMRPDFGEDSVEAWQASDYEGGNPGRHNVTFEDDLANVVINEVLSHTDLPDIDFIELYNHSNSPVDLGGLTITDDTDPGDPQYVQYTIPGGTTIPARGHISFDQTTLGFSLDMQGDRVYLRNAAGDRMIDAIKFGAQKNGVSFGRSADGADEFRVLSSVTPDAPNATPVNNDIVINEIMYHPISQNTADEFVELYNRGASDVDLGNWKFTEGIRYTFPVGTTIGAGEYLVIAKDALRLIAANPVTLDASNTVGDYSGSLADGGERIVLARPDDPALPLQDFIVIDEVAYADGESWGIWADGGGSSLELIDPNSDNMRASNWADSDETNKAPWTLIEHTGVLDNGRNGADEIQIFLEGSGEALLDNVEVFKSGAANQVANGTFEGGSGGWIIQGTHIDSHLETTEGYGSSQSLHLVASRTGDNSVNRVEHDLSSSLAIDATVVTIRARVRWLAGTPGILLRLHGNWLEAPGFMDVPMNLGSPGAANSRQAANAGPAIYDVTHLPILPAAGQDVVVTARVSDVDGLGSVNLKYRNDTDAPSTIYTVAMNDNGTGGDAIAGDGVYSATISGQGDNDLVAFYVEAADSHTSSPMTARFPTASDGEAHVMFGQDALAGTFGTYRFWMAEADRLEWATRQKFSDQPIHGTFVYGDFRVIYNAGARFRGSPFIRSSGDPETKDTSYVFYVPKDSRVIGSTSFNLDRLESDGTKQRERMSLWIADQVDTPFFNQRYVHLFVNENPKNTIYADAHSPNDDYVNAYWSDGTDGELFKIDDWFEFNDNAQVGKEFNDNGQMRLYTTTGGEKKQARYRWSWRKEPMGGFNDDYTLFFALVDGMNYDYASPEFAATVPAIVDYDEWMHVFAVQHVINNWDSYGFNRGKNMSLYRPDDGQWQMIMWDLDHSHMTGAVDNNNLFSINDPILKNEFFNYPLFRRTYWRAIYEIAEAMEASKIDPYMDANYAAFQANGINPESPDANIKAWVAGRRAWLLGQVAAIDSGFAITTNGGDDFSTPSQIVTIEGTAPVAVKTMFLNGREIDVDFNSVTGWQLMLGLAEGGNVLLFEGYDAKGNLVASDTISVTFTNTAVSPLGQIVINEIMYHPADGVQQGEFIEIHNASGAGTAFDLSGWRMDGVDFTFAPGSIITAGEYVVIVENASNFASAYTSSGKILGQYGGSLSNGSETLRLQLPAAGGLWTTVDEVTYSDALPWPAAADGTGPSLQRIDPTRDTGWIGNWAADSATQYTPGAVNSVYEILPGFPQVRINEILGSNVDGLTDNMGDYDPWLELHDVGGTNVITVEVHQANPDGGDVTMELSLDVSQPAGSETIGLVAPSQAIWKYLDDGSNQDAAWRELTYNDAAWAEGRGRFGYGDNDGRITTPLSYGPASNDKYITYYFRHEFEVADASLFSSLDLLAQRDDGIIVYLNGHVIMRDHMPDSGVNYETYATGGAVGGSSETDWISPASPINLSYLVTGTNIITAEIHQISPTSSDIGFDLSLTGERIIIGSATNVIPFDATWTVLDDGSDQGVMWREPGFDDSQWPSGQAILGYGNGGEATTLAGGATTYYFRHEIDLPEVALLNPVVNLRADDGAIVYLNGEEILRVNMPAGPVDFTTRALAPVDGPAEADFTQAGVDPALFRPDTGPGLLDDMYLTDDYTQLLKWAFPAGVPLDNGEYLTVWLDGETAEQTPADMHTNFAIDQLPGSLALVWNHGGTPIVVDYVDYDYTSADQSQGLWPNGRGEMAAMATPTPAAANSGPIVGQVIISEVHYNPADLSDYEFIELFNRGPSAVNLWETYGATDYPWEIEGFEFAVGATVQPNEAIVVVSFDPAANPTKLAAFRTRYGLETSPVQIVGSYGANLSNSSERICLERPLAPVDDPAFTPYETVDLVRYGDESPWPTEADGGGDSLNRISAGAWGNDAASWAAAEPTPGFSHLTVTPLVVSIPVGATVDTLVIAGPVALDGDSSLEIVVSGGAEAFKAGTYTLIQAGGALTGTFANVTVLTGYVSINGNGLTYDYEAGTVTLTLDMDLNPGDANLDGATDVSDRIIWNNNNFIEGTTFVTGDFNNDGATDVSDRIIWNNHNFTEATATPPAQAPVTPTPVAVLAEAAPADSDADAAPDAHDLLAVAGVTTLLPAEPVQASLTPSGEDGPLTPAPLVSIQRTSLVALPVAITASPSQVQLTGVVPMATAAEPAAAGAAQLEPDLDADLVDILGERPDA